MLVQDYLRKYGLEKLKEEFAINVVEHEDGRTILNYDQIDSRPKTHPIVRECRGLVLDRHNNFNLVARSFGRFFNMYEVEEDTNKFDWSDCIAYDKEDGSLITLYWFNGEAHLNTRGSFGHGTVGTSEFTWRQLFGLALLNRYNPEAAPHSKTEDFKLNELFKNHNFMKPLTYVFELCSSYNKIVTSYQQPTLFLLSVFDGEKELSPHTTSFESWSVDIPQPKVQRFHSPAEVQAYIDVISKDRPDFEGVVLLDKNGHRLKVKSVKYLELHRTANNGSVRLEDMVAILLRGDKDEFVLFFPEYLDKLNALEEKIVQAEKEVGALWAAHKDLDNRKEFALSIKASPYSSYLFQAKDGKGDPISLMRGDSERLAKFFV